MRSSNPSRNPTVEVDSLVKIYGSAPALDGVSFSLYPGEFLTIFGPNGAGKTTMLKILSTLLRPTSGVVNLLGKDLRKNGDYLRGKIGIISHNSYLYPSLTAYENLRFYGSLYQVPNLRQNIEDVMRQVGLDPGLSLKVKDFSRGMVQRLSIARAIIHGPEIILMDEPYTGLDQHAANLLRRVLQKLHTGERTIIMTTHNLQRGLELCDRVAILHRGKLVFHEERRNVDPSSFEEVYMGHLEGS